VLQNPKKFQINLANIRLLYKRKPDKLHFIDSHW